VIVSSIFDKEPGTGLPETVEIMGRNMLDVVRPQLWLIRERYFTGDQGQQWPPAAFAGFLGFPLIAGYILGFLGAFLQRRKIGLSDSDILRSVIDVHNAFLANRLDVEMPVHYMMQQSSFKFGLDVGAADFSGGYKGVLLAASQLFLKHDDPRTLKLNLQLFCDGHGVPLRTDQTFDEIIGRWSTQKRYSMS
jgi:hypothetical protein